jgi:lipoprotein-releasing system ATP-binding protein
MSELIVKTQQVKKVYNNGLAPLEVLKGIDLEVAKEEFLAIQGPSGAGKSTLLHILGGLDNPTDGKVYFEDESIFGLDEGRRAAFRNKNVGFVFQFYHLLPEFNCLENVLMPAYLKSWWDRKKAVVYAKWLLDNLGLSGRLQHKPNQLSGGEQQRVAIARSLINKPRLLLCDEPTGNLDSENGKNILDMLKKVNQQEKTSVVMVTHDNDIAREAHRVIHLRDGMVVN